MKTVGPMFSLGASGTIGGVITMATWKGRPYARIRVTPSNPRSAGQTASRAMMAFLSQQWAALDSGAKASWAELGQQGSYSPFNAFVKANMNYWAQYQMPGQEPNPARTETPAGSATCVAVAGVKSVSLTLDDNGSGTAWGAIIFLIASGTVQDLKTQVVKIVPHSAGTPTVVEISGLLTGTTYEVAYKSFTPDGNVGALSTTDSFTPS
jgi:hypothetical protein